MFLREKAASILIILVGLFLVLLGLEGPVVSLLSFMVGIFIVIRVSEPMVEGLGTFSLLTGLSPHVTGVVSSLASNLPEGVMTGFMLLSPHLREVAILTVMLASAFNGLLLGVLVVMLTYRGGDIPLSKEELEHDVEIMRIAIALCVIIFGTGIILRLFSNNGGINLPREAPIFLLFAYIGYIFFVSRKDDPHSQGIPEIHPIVEENNHGEREEGRGWIYAILLGLVGVVISAELISGSSEYLVHMLDLHVVIAATLIGFSGSVPEHAMAIIGARRGHVEMGVSNLLSGIIQSIMLIFPLAALIVPVELDGYVLYQFMAIAVTLWIVKKAIIDDHRLTLDEGVSILLIHVLGILLFDELSLLI
jgi:Ca2+/Na+ antiporter